MVQNALQGISVNISGDDRKVMLSKNEMSLCNIHVEDEFYRITTGNKNWADNSKFVWTDEGTEISYCVDMPDECAGEVKRLVLFCNQSDNTVMVSELCRKLTLALFEKAYVQFMEQADRNAASKKAQGSKVPYGFEGNNIFDGADFRQHFGQGGASKTPYINWWVLSIYYLVDSGNIVMGIEEDRYPYLSKMRPLKFEQIGNKKTNIAVFYESTKDNVDYDKNA